MKKCSFCGNEYPDAVAVCPADGEPLHDPLARRKKVTGVWRGVYGYGPREKRPGCTPVAFTLKLKQGWTSHFTGSVTDDAPLGAPGIGTIDGYFSHPSFEFTKQMPVGRIIKEDGTRISLREHFIELGKPCPYELPAAPILYQGACLDANRVQGTWAMQPMRIALPGRSAFSTRGSAGFWCAEFITENVKADPTGGPALPLFDKSLLSPRELRELEGVPPCSLGKFSVAEADLVTTRLAEADIWCRFSQDDSARREEVPISAMTGGSGGTEPTVEIFVNPEEEARALEVIGWNKQVRMEEETNGLGEA